MGSYLAIKKTIVILIFLALVFTLGWTAHSVSLSPTYSDTESPVSSIGSRLRLLTTGVAPEIASPQDWITEDRIHVYKDKIVIDVAGADWAKFTNTNSMLPVFDSDNNIVRIMPDDVEKIKPGDIISYRPIASGGIVIHRVVQTGSDEKGWYALAKGDNLPSVDPGKIRKEQILGVTAIVIY